MTSEFVRHIVDDLLSGSSVLVSGLPGSGRSHLLRATAKELSLQGVTVVSLRGNRILADRPLSALSLAGIDIDNGQYAPGSVPALAWAASALEAVVERRTSVIMIDDAEALDRATMGVIANVRMEKSIPLLLAGPYGIPRDGLLTQLIAAAQPGVAVVMEEKLFGEITQMVNALVGGPTEARTVSQIATLSGGLPGLVQTIVRIGLRNGHLVFRDGAWYADGSLWDDGLRVVLLPFLAGLDKDDVDALTRLANSEDTTQRDAGELIGPGRVSDFVRHGLLRIDRASDASRVYVYPPALAEYMRRAGGGLVVHERRPERGSNHWPVNMSGLEAAALAHRLHVHWTSQVAECWQRWVDEKSLANAVPLLIAIFSGVVDDERIAAVAEKTPRDGDDASLVKVAGLEAAYRAVWKRDLKGAVADLERYRAAYPRHDSFLRGCMGHLLLVHDRVPTPAILEDPPAEGELTDPGMLLAARAEMMIAQGRVREAADLLASMQTHSERALILRQTLQGLVLILGDDVDAGIEWSVACLRTSIDALETRSIACHAYVAALGMCMRGRFDELESLVEIVFRWSEMDVFQNHYKTGLFALGAFVADWEGRREYARSLALQAKMLGAKGGLYPGMLTRLDELLGGSGPAARIWDEVDALVNHGYIATAIYLAVLAVECDPDPVRAAEIVAAGSACQSPVLQAMTAYIEAAAAKDAARFVDVVEGLRKASGPLDSTRALVTWALLLREQGDHAGWLERAQAAWEEAGAITRPCNGLFTRLVEAVDLTAREAEVAGYAVLGQSAPGIAAKVGVSARTIETHLQSIYRKTGVSTREDLRQILNTWCSL